MDLLRSMLDWLSHQPNWVWLLVVAVVTHRLTLRREQWNREQHRRTEQRKVVADFAAAVNDLGPAAADLATWLNRRQSPATPKEHHEITLRCDEAMEVFAEKVFGVHRAMDLVKMTLVDPQLCYSAAFAMKLAQDVSQVGGHRQTDPTAQTYSLELLYFRCTTGVKELMASADKLVADAVVRIPPQTTWFHQRVSGAFARSKTAEIQSFIERVDVRSASYFRAPDADEAGA
ncbi:hypothetical protein [Nocardia abscessus]|uniref:hypothetical protein n=1 Tax=Nocardia abscessus TaxID=120957 RepID=UPI002454C4F1|nr:hypothetical protein [Nocardia abscessus]